MIRVCFVCLGNICRSPTAEAVFGALVAENGLADHISFDSAGTSDYHIGEPADRRSAQAAARHGVTLRGRARQFQAADFETFDYVVAMDRSNLDRLVEMAPSEGARKRISMLRAWDADADGADVPDPYWSGRDGFELVFQICRAGCTGLIASIRSEHGI